MAGLYDELLVLLHGIWSRRWIALAVAWGVCMLGWLGVFVLGGVLVSLIAGLMGGGVMQVVLYPAALLMAAMFFTSMLFSVRDCFSTDVYDEPPASADRPE